MPETLSFYHTVKRLGIPDSQIILMMAEDLKTAQGVPRAQNSGGQGVPCLNNLVGYLACLQLWVSS